MTTHLVTVSDTATTGRSTRRNPAAGGGSRRLLPSLVTGAGRRLVGILPFKDLVISRADRPVREFMADADIRVLPELDQEEVARIMARYNLPSVPVVDHDDVLLGRVADDVIDVVEAETTEDLLRLRRRLRRRSVGRELDRIGAEPVTVALCQFAGPRSCPAPSFMRSGIPSSGR